MGTPLPLTRSVDRQIALRACKRVKIFEPAKLTWDEQPRRAHLLDLSHGGALIDVMRPPDPESIVRIECGSLSVDARIIWRDASRCGVVFLTTIDDEVIAQFL